MQGASHAQKYFKHLKVFPKAKRGESILDIISADAEAAGTSQVVLSTKNESTLPQESINAEVAEGESAGHGSLVASHAQKYFKHLKSVPKAKRRETILDIISAYAEATGTTDVVLSTKNERTLPQESINAEQTITVAEGHSAGHGSLKLLGAILMARILCDHEYIFNSSFGTDDMFMEQEDVNEAGFCLDAATSLLPSEQPCTATSSGPYSHC
ncbi:hypothetical protein FXO38_25810 [Capsicum annuum]|nr:hypothetical protein FXO38_25810 [Capsicum annuum]KAF3677001.1 hypothetical protein FXO37_05046 [Capsicum annuum]